MPYMTPLIVMALVRFISCFTALAGFSDQFSRALGYLFHECIEVWIMWQVIETEKDFKYLIKGCLYVFLLACVYGFYEYFTNTNPLAQYKTTLTAQGFNIYCVDAFRGYRLMSVFEHPIGAGMTCGLIGVFILTVMVLKKNEIRNKKLAYVVVAFSMLCVLLSKMRGGILFTLISVFAFMNLRKKKSLYVVGGIAVVAVVMLPLYSDSLNVFLSLFNTKAQEAVGGSNLQMRFEQFIVIKRIMNLSPLAGLGDQFEEYLSSSYLSGALGFESVFFEEMAKHGLLGVGATLLMIFYSVFKIPKQYHSREIMFISLAYWLTYTLTSTPSFRLSLYYFVLFYFIKNTKTYLQSSSEPSYIKKKRFSIRIKSI